MKRPNLQLLTILAMLAISAMASPLAFAAKYHVSKTGDDANDGLSVAAAFATIQKGVDALNPGDTLVIAPGEYRQSVMRDNLGGDAAVTTIRAQIPGTVTLRGDVPGPDFTLVKGKRFVYEANYDAKAHGSPQAVIEPATRSLFSYTADPAELEFIPGLFHHDPEAGKLYISTSDMKPANDRAYSIVVNPASGIYLGKPRNVTIDGLVVTGFFAIGAKRGAPYLWDIPWGIAMASPVNCKITNSTVYFNAGGIIVDRAKGVLIDQCIAFGNHSNYNAMSGNIMSMGGRYGAESSGVIIRNSRAFDGSKGIHQYGGMVGHVVISDNLSWNNQGADMHIKTGRDEDNRKYGIIRNSVAFNGNIGGRTSRHNLMAGRGQYPSVDESDIRGEQIPDLDMQREMADPDNLDFRLQSDSRFRSATPAKTDMGPFAYQDNIFYVHPQGDDQADGLSMTSAWRTLERATQDLRPGDTLYLAPGTYDSQLVINEAGAADQPVYIRGRGRGDVIIQGGLSSQNAAALVIDRLIFGSQVSLTQGHQVTLNNCVFKAGLTASKMTDLQVSHCVLPQSQLKIQESLNIHLKGNHFANASEAAVVMDDVSTVRYSDYNGYQNASAAWQVAGENWSLSRLQQKHDAYSMVLPANAEAEALAGRGPAGTSIGIYHQRRMNDREIKLIGPFVHSVTDTTVNIEWWTTAPTPLTVQWGETREMTNTHPIDAHRYGTFSLTGLQPGKTYHFKLTAHAASEEGKVITFKTNSQPSQPRVFHVAPDGDDARDGSSRKQAWRTLNHAADQVRAGDTVLIASGEYETAVRLRTTGDHNKPITFKASPGSKVTLSGSDRTLQYAFYSADKHHLHFDGLYFKGYADYATSVLPWQDRSPGNGNSGTFSLYRSGHLQITRCFNDGRGGGYATGLVWAVQSPELLVRNCVNMVTMGSFVTFMGCDNLRIINNVSTANFIYNHIGVNEPGQKVYLQNNIYTDNSLMTKVAAPFFELGTIESLVEGNNCYFPRTPDEVKKLFMFYHQEAYDRAAVSHRLQKEFSKPLTFNELTRLSLAEYQEKFNPDSGSFIADPQFVASQGLNLLTRDGKPMFMSDALTTLKDLDFNGLFATNPQVVERNIGLQREAFTDFHFNQAVSSN